MIDVVEPGPGPEPASSSTAVDSSAAARAGIVVVAGDRSPSEPSVVGPLHSVASSSQIIIELKFSKLGFVDVN